MKSKRASGDVQIRRDTPQDSGELTAISVKETDSGEIPATSYGAACDPNDPTCEACQ
jgi:hypothetical protein